MTIGKLEFVISKNDYDAVLFDLDGVVTQTAKVHIAAWETLFNEYLKQRSQRLGEPYRPFDPDADYRNYVDGKLRYDGVASFLASRGIALPYGNSNDPPEAETICGLGNRKNALYLELLKKAGVETYPSTLELIRQLRAKGFETAVVSASKNCAEVLEAAHVSELFTVRVDGNDLERLHLRGKPAPDSVVEATRRLAAQPSRAIVVEDAIAGVIAGRLGQFGCVIGVDRTGHPDALKEAGADVVVPDLAMIDVT
jgi:beta-phosphoglucomutase family hydrolase